MPSTDAPAPGLTKVHINPCSTPRLPPRQIELSDIPVLIADQHYIHGVKDKAFYIEKTGIGAPSNHRITREWKKQPTWAKFVFIKSIYGKADRLDQLAVVNFRSVEIKDLTGGYRHYYADPAVVQQQQPKPRRKKNTQPPQPPAQPPITPPVPPGSKPPCPGNTNNLTVNAISLRLSKIESIIVHHQNETACRLDHVNDRLTLILNEIFKMRQDISDYSDDVDIALVSPIDIVVNKVDGIARKFNKMLGIEDEDDMMVEG
ncbi:hypothetical protein GGI42DRAFT_263287 [Trichoderma sp. SZMC 28013]